MLWFAVIILGLAVYLVLRRRPKNRAILPIVAVAASLLIGWFILRPEPATTAVYGQFQSELGQGQSVLLELQSPY